MNRLTHFETTLRTETESASTMNTESTPSTTMTLGGALPYSQVVPPNPSNPSLPPPSTHRDDSYQAHLAWLREVEVMRAQNPSNPSLPPPIERQPGFEN